MKGILIDEATAREVWKAFKGEFIPHSLERVNELVRACGEIAASSPVDGGTAGEPVHLRDDAEPLIPGSCVRVFVAVRDGRNVIEF